MWEWLELHFLTGHLQNITTEHLFLESKIQMQQEIAKNHIKHS